MALVLVIVAVAPARAETVRDQLWVTDGDVRAVAYTNNTIYIGGNFQNVGPAIGGMAVFDGSSAAAHTPYFGIAGTVDAMVTDGLGGYYVGGLFTGAHGIPRSNLLHFDSSGNVTSWNPGTDGEVLALSLYGSTLYVGGSFGNVAGQVRSGLAAIDTSGTLLSWAPNPNSTVNVVHAAYGSLYVGGKFTTIASQAKHYIAAFDLVTGSLRTWDANIQTSPGYSVEAIAPFGNTLYLGGIFGTFGTTARTALAAVDTTSGAVLPWNPNTYVTGGYSLHIYTIGVTQLVATPFTRTVWVGGDFNAAGGALRSNIASIDGSTGALNSWNPGTNGPVRSITLKLGATGGATTIYAGGDFTQAGGLNRPYLCSISGAGAVSGWSPIPTGSVHTIFVGGGGIVSGGAFYSAGMTIRANIASLDATSGQVTPWNLGASGPVNALLVHNNTLYVGGGFNELGISVRFGAAAVDIPSGNVTAWDPGLSCTDITCTSPTVNAIAAANRSNIVYLGGLFVDATGQFRRNLAAVDATTGSPLAFNANVNFQVRSVAVSERNVLPFDPLAVYAGGDFNVVNAGVNGHDGNGVVRYSLASFDPSTGAVTGWAPSPVGTLTVNTMTLIHPGLNAGTLWIGGQFSSMGGATRNNCAAVDAGTGVATAWDPNVNGIVRVLLLGPSDILGGDFTTVGGQTRNHIASVDGTGAVTSWNPDAADAVMALTSYGGTIFAGGSFSRVSNYSHAFFAGIGDGTVTGVESEPAPEHPIAIHAAPNPFGDHTGLRFEMARSGMARVAVYDAAGRLVKQLQNGFLNSGEHVIAWTGQDEANRPVASGVYFMRVEAPSLNQTAKVFRLR
jgi:hypothetical protein